MKALCLCLRESAEGVVHPFLALIVGLMMNCDAGAVTSQSFRVSATVVPGVLGEYRHGRALWDAGFWNP